MDLRESLSDIANLHSDVDSTVRSTLVIGLISSIKISMESLELVKENPVEKFLILFLEPDSW